MDNLRIVPGSDYPGEGVSHGLARGLLVFYGDCNLTGEGMGIGTIALRDRTTTYFSRSRKDATDENGVFTSTFTLDTRMTWIIRGKPSPLLTRWIEYGISTYMRHPRVQSLVMLPVPPLRSLLNIRPLFETIPSLGSVTFTYRIAGLSVTIEVHFNLTAQAPMTVCILNELSGSWFTAGWDGEHVTSPPPGWEKITHMPVSVVDPTHRIRFFLNQPSVSPPYTLYRGREQTGDACWAGFCIELDFKDGSRKLHDLQYSVGFTTGDIP
jgi:hypothetical protein